MKKIIVLIAIIILPINVFAVEFQVNDFQDLSDINQGDGLCENRLGSCSLRAAIQETNALPENDTIILPLGHFIIDNHKLGSLFIDDSLEIIGRGIKSTIIDGNKKVRVFSISDNGILVSIKNLTIKNGYHDSQGSGGILTETGFLEIDKVSFEGNLGKSGGGIHSKGDLKIENSFFKNNSSMTNGGAIFQVKHKRKNKNSLGGGIFSNKKLEISHSSFSNNSSLISGGGIYTEAILSLDHSSFENNHSGNGGALYGHFYMIGYKDQIVISNSNFLDNSSGFEGGALKIHLDDTGTRFKIEDSVFSHNQSHSGGAIYLFSRGYGMVEILDSQIIDNRSAEDGGGVYVASNSEHNTFGTIVFRDLNIEGNQSSGRGGGVFSKTNMIKLDEDTFRPSLFIASSSLIRNAATHGAGIYNDHLEPRKPSFFIMVSSTIAENIATEFGGGIYSNGHIMIYYSTIANNNIFSFHDINLRGVGIFVDGRMNEDFNDFPAITLGRSIIKQNHFIIGRNSFEENCISFGTIDSKGYNLSGIDSVDIIEGCFREREESDIIGQDPSLLPLVETDFLTKLYPLDFDSPVIDIIPKEECRFGFLWPDFRVEGVLSDQNHIRRFFQGEGCDAGAYERIPVEMQPRNLIPNLSLSI